MTIEQLREVSKIQDEIKELKVFSEKLSESLMRVAELDGVYPYSDEDNICIKGGNLNDYLICGYLSQLIQSGDMEIKINQNKIPYLMKLLKMN